MMRNSSFSHLSSRSVVSSYDTYFIFSWYSAFHPICDPIFFFFHSRSDSGLFLLSCRLWMNIRPYPLAPLSSALPPFIALLGPASFFLLNISSTLFQISYFLGLNRAYVCAFQECLILSYLISPPSFFPSPSVILFLPLSPMTCIPALFISVIYLLSCRHIASQK
ncbi:hypothetical protein BJ165DRAFT_584090 [Panaeolus papilionaceus]|nr:hypothetical protein BJ165DRAFT_584090 [Panaeolus papilionaceus]